MDSPAAITLISDNPVLVTAIPPQLRHAQIGECSIVETWDAFVETLHPTPPKLAIVDCSTSEHALNTLPQLHKEHPLMACIGIGTQGQAEHFTSHPLCDFTPRPLAMPALLHSAEHLLYERITTAGQQTLPLAQGADFCPAEKLLRHSQATLELTDKESAMLLCLYHHRHGWLARQQLLEDVWGYNEAITTHTLETHLYRLRTKLKEIFGEHEAVLTKQGSYRLQA